MRDIILDAKALELALDAAADVVKNPERGYSYHVAAIQVAILEGMKFALGTVPVEAQVADVESELKGIRAFTEENGTVFVILNGGIRTQYLLMQLNGGEPRPSVIQQFVNRLAVNPDGSVAPVKPGWAKVALEEKGFRFSLGPMSHLIEVLKDSHHEATLRGFLEFLQYEF